jgi:hypothetical protein
VCRHQQSSFHFRPNLFRVGAGAVSFALCFKVKHRMCGNRARIYHFLSHRRAFVLVWSLFWRTGHRPLLVTRSAEQVSCTVTTTETETNLIGLLLSRLWRESIRYGLTRNCVFANEKRSFCLSFADSCSASSARTIGVSEKARRTKKKSAPSRSQPSRLPRKKFERSGLSFHTVCFRVDSLLANGDPAELLERTWL